MTNLKNWENQFEQSFSSQIEKEEGDWFPGTAGLIVTENKDSPVYGASGPLSESILKCGLSQLLETADGCESPIEGAMFAALAIAGFQECDRVESGFFRFGLDGIDTLAIEPQFKIDRFRVDFQVSLIERFGYGENDFHKADVLVECDGHDYHERTKTQVKRDKSRDRKLQSLGHQVLHFTGSEIWNDPCGAALEVVHHLQRAVAVERERA